MLANSEHPIAKSVVEHAKRLLKTFGSTKHVIEAKDFEVHTGAGVSGRVGDNMVLAGNKRLMWENNVQIAGAFAVIDPMKPEAARIILYLHLMNMRIWLERMKGMAVAMVGDGINDLRL
ncbi:copper-transporting ATPase HMA4-like [Pyrus communis]|uniref:copper-transporting ATPase HMA4-like n=1 Tax=Pyrus communis TaxID=23211 RepID=UPI0035C1E5A9